jgi:hypothetical protein
MDEFLLDCCFNSGYKDLKFRVIDSALCKIASVLCYIVRSRFNKNFYTDSVLCYKARSHHKFENNYVKLKPNTKIF